MDTLSNYTPSLSERLTSFLARNWYGDTREGYRSANRLMDIAGMTPVGTATGMYDAGRSLGEGNYGAAALGAVLAGLPIPGAIKKEAKAGIRAFHGSPHSFEKFDISKIGSGEGAQAYGHGLYFADAEGTAKAYRDKVKDMGAVAKVNARLSELARIMHADEAGGYRNFKTDNGRKAAAEYDALMEQRSAISNAPGHMYEVNIDADPNQFFDWDKPLSEQPEKFRTFVDKALANDPVYQQWKVNGVIDNVGAGYLYDRLTGPKGMTRGNQSGREAASNYLKDEGIPGIKYLDAGSRTKGDGSRNYVVFDDKLVSIVRKYGIAGVSAMLGFDILANMEPAQAAQLKSLENQ